MDVDGQVWDLTTIRPGSKAEAQLMKDDGRIGNLDTWLGWIQASIEASKERIAEEARQNAMAWGGGHVNKGAFAYRGQNAQ